MSEGRRPGGLTVLAVLNFVFIAWNAIFILGLSAWFLSSEARAEFERHGYTNASIVLRLVLLVVSAIILLISGIGYLKLNTLFGKYAGTFYAVLAFGGSLAVIAMREAMNVGDLIGFVYPVLTLVLLHTTFRYDFPPLRSRPPAPR